MKVVGILPNLEKDENLVVTKRLVAYLKNRGCEPLLSKEIAKLSDFLECACDKETLYKKADFVITLGGDGTLLGAGRRAAPYQTPILGINLGNLGFLTAEEKGHAECAIDSVLKGQFKVEHRMMLEASVFAEPKRLTGIRALNDVCITRGFSSKILECNVFVNDEFVDSLRADGVIVCTPTGSTAYNLSAGGPVMKADARIIAITPICPHTLTSRSIILSAEDTVTVEVLNRADEDFIVSADGQTALTLKRQNLVQVKKSPFETKIIKTNPFSFYEVLRKKLAR